MTPSTRIVRNKTTETESTGKGMPALSPQEDRSRLGAPQIQRDVSVEASLHMPHERDQSVDMTDDTPDPVVKQAQRDESRGLKDTSKAPQMDATYKKLK